MMLDAGEDEQQQQLMLLSAAAPVFDEPWQSVAAAHALVELWQLVKTAAVPVRNEL